MFRLPTIRIDFFSFLLGFLSGVILWWIIGQIRKAIPAIKANAAARREAQRAKRDAGIIAYLSTELRRRIQNSHIAAALFPLDEILIQPKFFAPLPPPLESGEFHYDRLITRLLPYLPDVPEILSPLGWPQIGPEELLRSNARIALVGSPGSGKTVSLHVLANTLLTKSANKRYPILLHVLDLDLSQPDPYLALALAHYNSKDGRLVKEIRAFFEEKLAHGEAVLLVDGLDQLPKSEVDLRVSFIRTLLEKHPGLPVVLAASGDYLDGLLEIGFEVIGLAAWSRSDRAQLIDRWTQAWQADVATKLALTSSNSQSTRPEILTAWLQQDQEILSPMELSLKIWGAFSGDLAGSSPHTFYLAFLLRSLESDHLDKGLCASALQTIQSNAPFLVSTGPLDTSAASLANAGLAESNYLSRTYFKHLSIAAFLAAQSEDLLVKQFTSLSDLEQSDLAYLKFKGHEDDVSALMEKIINLDDPMLLRQSAAILRVIGTSTSASAWKTNFFKTLVQQLQRESTPIASRARLVGYALRLNDPGIQQLFRQMLSSPYAGIRTLGLLGCAASNNQKALPEITACLQDENEQTRLLSVFALNAIGTSASTQILVEALLNGGEEIRMAAAQAFAMAGGEGHEILQEAATYDDLLTRRATVSGLGLVHDDWTTELLEKISVEDGQWVVRNAASQMLESRGKLEHLHLLPYAPLWDQPWLIQFTSQKGIGLAPGEYPLSLLLEAIKTGTPVQQHHALFALRRKQSATVSGNLFSLALSMESQIKDTAAWCLWCMAACGSEIPSPLEYGLG